MNIEHGSPFHAHALRLRRGEDLREAMEAKVKEGNFGAVVVVTCVGSVRAIDWTSAGPHCADMTRRAA